MDRFLNKLSKLGRRDSGGSFTIDMSRARFKLAEFQLAKYEHYPRFLLSAAEAADCSSLDVTLVRSKKHVAGFITTVFFRGWAFEDDQLHYLDPLRQNENLAPSVRYLGIALSALCSRVPVTLRSRRGKKFLKVKFSREGVEASTETLANFPDNTTTLRIGINQGPVMEESFREIAFWAGTPLTFNGQTYVSEQPWQQLFQDSLAALVGGDHDPNIVDPALLKPRLRIDDPEDDFSAGLILLTTPEKARRIGLKFLVHGLAYPAHPELEKMDTGVCGYLRADHLRRDLSYQALRLDPELASARDALHRKIKFLLGKVQETKVASEFRQWARLERLSYFLDGETSPMPLDENVKKVENPHQEALKESQEYLRRIRNNRSIPRFALRNVREYLEWMKLQDKSSENALLLEFLFSSLAGDEPTIPPVNSLVKRYIEKVQEWKWAEMAPVASVIDSSWLLPGKIENESLALSSTLPDWANLVIQLQNAQVKEALETLENSPKFGLKEHPNIWFALFWHGFKGRLDWGLETHIRARLSVLAPDGDRRTWPLEYLYSNGYTDDDFWPRFFYTLVFLKDETRLEQFWQNLIFQSLIDAALVSDDPLQALQTPFLERVLEEADPTAPRRFF